MNQWDCQVKSKQELATDLMFKEIIELRNQCVKMSGYIDELSEVIDENKDKLSIVAMQRVDDAKKYLKSLEK